MRDLLEDGSVISERGRKFLLALESDENFDMLDLSPLIKFAEQRSVRAIFRIQPTMRRVEYLNLKIAKRKSHRSN